MARARDVLKCCLAALGLALACGGGLRTVPTGPHPARAANPILVEYPPPPAKVERVAADPGEPCRWMDGHWAWAGRRWHWVAGAWVHPPAGCHYARSVLAWYAPPELGPARPSTLAPPADGGTREHGSRLYYTEPRWYPTGSAKSCGAPLPCAIEPAGEARN